MTNFTGTGANETIPGSAGNDTLIGGGGNDLIQGLGGEDLLQGDGGGAGGGGLTLTATAQAYLSADKSLSNGLGGAQGFGETALPRADDSYTGGSTGVDVSSVFTGGLNFFGTNYTRVYINNNGAINFSSFNSSYTPTAITGTTNNPIITPYFADVETNVSAGVVATPGGNSTGTNQVFYDLDTINHVFTVTWNDVGYYADHIDKLNAFQLQLVDRGGGDFDIIFRYEAINWTTGDASGGSGGLGGTVSRAGYSAGNGVNFFELPQSGNQAQMLALDTNPGNSGREGVWQFEVRSGNVSSPGNDTLDGGTGNDLLDGGPGTDVALFSGTSAAYTVTRLSQNSYRVVGPDGTDTLQDVEMLQFGAGAPMPILDLLPPVQFTATGNLPIDMSHDFNLPFEALQQFIPIAAYLEPNQIRLALQNGGEVIGQATSIALNFVSNLSAGDLGPQEVAHSLAYTATGTFAPAYNLARNIMISSGATVGGAPLTGNALLNAGLALQNGAQQIDLTQIMFTGLTSVVDGQPHYQITDINLAAAEAAPFFLPALVPGGTIDIDGIIDQVGERRSVITGSPGNDILASLGGNDTINGGGGIDTIIVPSAMGNATVNTNGDQSTISGAFGTLVVNGVEGVNFTDQTDVISGNFPVLSIDDVTMAEGQNGVTNAIFTASLTGPAPAGGVTAAVIVTGVGDHPAAAGSDFSVPPGLLTIAAGATTGTITVPIIGDALLEATETFAVALSNVTNAIQGVDVTGIGTIQNDDGNLIAGDNGANTLFGTPNPDYIVGAGGNDTIIGKDQNDLLDGGDGDDIITGDLANVAGQGGADSIAAGAGNDVVICQEGNDTVDGGAGNDTIGAFLGNTSLSGGDGNDVLLVADGSSTLSGGAGNDTVGIFAGSNMNISGGSGDDVFFAGGGTNMTLNGGSGSDVIVGGPGTDIFRFENGFGPTDSIYAFDRTQGDKISLSPSINGTGIATGAQALAFTSSPPGFEGSTLIALGTSLIVVVGVPQLFATDFIIG